MTDRNGTVLQIGQTVAFSFGWTANAYLGVITAFTKKMVKIASNDGGNKYTKMPHSIIVCK